MSEPINSPIGITTDLAADARGFTLLETIIALGLMLIVAAGVLPLGLIAVTTTENQGHLTTRTTEYAQDKIEQLMALAYNDAVSDTREFPADDDGGSGLAVGGSADPDAPVDLYVDYLDPNGNLLAAGDTDDWFYKRAWQISTPAGTANLKQITVTATVRAAAAGGVGRIPRTTLTIYKTFPF